MIRATQGFKLGVIAATGGIALLYLVKWFLAVSSTFKFRRSTAAAPWESGFSLFRGRHRGAEFVLDFDMIETGVQGGAPKYMEWYGAFGLMVTLIWLYLEILRLLGKARRR